LGSKYSCYAELARHETLGLDYRFLAREVPGAAVLVAAPHGGMIEIGTSEIARLIAGREYSLFVFEGLKAYGTNRDLHITSHQFDHPACLAMAGGCESVLAIHGCVGEARIHIGGLDDSLKHTLVTHLADAGFAVELDSPRYPGRHRLNICNRGARAQGAQLEITYDLRSGASAHIARAVRAALSAWLLKGSRPPHG
jgi:phage replication-related protein YjqB (UPF0714/DUF867 family)